MKKEIYLAGGCFWGIEAYFKQIHGIESTEVGYAQGYIDAPSYEEVSSGKTGHTETCKIVYNPQEISLFEILEEFLKIIDPTSINRQSNDIGTQYRSGVYFIDPVDKPVIISVIKSKQNNYDLPIVVEVQPLDNFWEAEFYHQDYLNKNPHAYCHIDLSLYKKKS